MTERWSRIAEIFEAALAEPPERRDAYLAEACAGDAELETEVRSLLAHHDESDGFLEPSRTPLRCMKYSSPSSLWMKPKPLSIRRVLIVPSIVASVPSSPSSDPVVIACLPCVAKTVRNP